jgi:hypothetical protein
MSNPWDVPDRPLAGDANVEDIYRAVGGALTSWEFVEESVAEIFAVLTGSVAELDKAPALRAYVAVLSFRARREMVEAAAKAFFHNYPNDTLSKELETLLNVAGGWSGRRNDIAHGRTAAPFRNLSGFVLLPGQYNTRKQKVGENPSYCYSAEQIKRFEIHFDSLYDDLRTYATRLDQWHRELLRARLKQSSS